MLWMPHFTGAGIVVNCTNRTNIRNRRVTEGHQKGAEMIYIENTSNDPAYNLAFEEYVFMNTDYDEPVLLLWQNAPAVIVGKYQNTLEEINYDYIREKEIHVIRRNTGGGAVYHDLGNLNYSFIIPDVESKVDFGTFTIPAVRALRACGIDAEQTGRNDILAGGRKFSGNAQQFSRHRLLHHGTLMFDVDMDAVSDALRPKAGKFRSKATQSVRSRVTNLKPLFLEAGGDPDMTTADFKALLLEWFDKEYDLKKVSLTEEQMEGVEKLRREKYATDEWNFGRSPKADIVRGDFFRCGQVEFHFQIEQHRIRSVKITGDFFTSRNIEEFETMFEGAAYDRTSILKILENADLQSFLGDVTAEELAEVIV